MSNKLAVNATKLMSALNAVVQAKLPTMIHGSPGMGKSACVRAVANQLKIGFIDCRLSQLEPVDLRGVPSVVNGQTKWNTPDFFPTEGEGILFLDEANQASQSTQAAAYQLVLDRQLGDYKLPDGWAVVLAGNLLTDKAIVNQMSSALKNRLVHLYMTSDAEDWCDWALRSGTIHPSVIGFIRHEPDLLNAFTATDKKNAESTKDSDAFFTQRTWEYASRILYQCEQMPVGQARTETEAVLLTGAIGNKAAQQFRGYLKHYRNLPPLDFILDKNNTVADILKAYPPSNDPSVKQALATMLSFHVDRNNIDKMRDYWDAIFKEDPEYRVLIARSVVVRDRSMGMLMINKVVNKNSPEYELLMDAVSIK